MRGLFNDELRALVRARLGAIREVVRSLTVRSTGVAESQIPALLGDAAGGVDGMSMAYLPGQGGVDLRLTIAGTAPAEADARLTAGAAILAERLGTFAYAEGATDLAEVVLAACRARGLRLAVAESCTGGLLGARVTAIPGASDTFRGGVVAYDDAVKREQLGVDPAILAAHGAVSEEVAKAMASGVRARLGAAIGVGITGIAGPDGGTAEKPVGLVWVAVDIEGEIRAHGGRLVGDRAEVRFRATQVALDMIRRALRPA